MRALLVIAVLATTSAIADAKRVPPPKPTKAEAAALKLAADWIAAMHFGEAKPVTSAVALTATPFYSLALTEEATACAESESANTAAATKSLLCLHDKIAPKGTPKLWRHTLGGPLAAHTKKLTDLAKNAIVVELDEGCDGTENQTLVIVKSKKIIAVLAQTAACTE